VLGADCNLAASQSREMPDALLSPHSALYAGRLKTLDWKTRDHNTGGGKRETISYGTPN